VYPDDNFTWISKYGAKLPEICDEGVSKVLRQQIAQIKAWLAAGDIKKVVCVLSSIPTDETLERYNNSTRMTFVSFHLTIYVLIHAHTLPFIN
jgi:hypothetical protein